MLITALRTNRRTLCHGFLWLILACPLLAQQLQPVTSQQADCGKFVQPAITTAGTFNSQNIDNRSAACDGFVVTYSPQGFATVSVTLQSANVTSTGAAGAFGAFGGTIATGYVNPATQITCSTATSCEIRATGYFPYVRIQIVTTGTGYLVAEFHGFKTNPNSGSGATSGGCVGTSATPCVVVGSKANGANVSAVPPILIEGIDYTTNHGIALEVDNSGALLYQTTINPLVDGTSNSATPTQSTFGAPYFFQVMPSLFNGASWDRQYVCANQAFVNLAASGNAQIIAASGSTVIRVCHIHLSTSAPETIQLTTGTGANCGTGNTVIDAYQNTSSLAMDFQPTAALRTAAAQALCINPSANTTLTGVIIYAQY